MSATLTGGAALLEVTGLRLALPDRGRKPAFGPAPRIEILRGIDLSVAAGDSVGIVGESGSGKSTLARTLVRLHRPTGGRIAFMGTDISTLEEAGLRRFRARMQMVFQDSQSSLNPRRTIGNSLADPLIVNGRVADPLAMRTRVGSLLERVGLDGSFVHRYPHQVSGGQRQRIGIARALALEPAIIVADEIVSGLDVSMQAQILDLLGSLRAATGISILLISHDLSVVRKFCDRVLVMRQGQVVESGTTARIFAAPGHPYTRRLLRAIPLPEIDPDWLDAVALDDEAEGAAADR